MTKVPHHSSIRESLVLPAQHHGACWLHRPSAQHRRHRHDELEVNLVLQGRASYLIGDRRCDLQRHDLLFLFPDQDHVLVDQSPAFSMYNAVFRQSLVRRQAGQSRRQLALKSPTGKWCRRLPAVRASRLARVWAAALAADTDDAINAGLAFLLLESWEAFAAIPASVGNVAVHPCVAAAVRAIAHDPSIAIASVARTVGLSRERLSRLFRHEMDATVVAFRTRCRLERAATLISGGSSNLLRVALDAGFGSYNQFHRVTTAAYGVSPRVHLAELATQSRA